MKTHALVGVRRVAWVLGLMALALALSASPGSAQTAEGTVIRNIATVDYEDANGNTYQYADTVDLTVGFQSGVDVKAQAATVTPTSPSTGNKVAFALVNTGNGPDTMTVTDVTTSDASVAALTGTYEIGGTPYASIAALNAFLELQEIAVGDSIVVEVVYNVPTGQGGNSATITLEATSERDGGSDEDSTDVEPPLEGDISVTPDGKPDEAEKEYLPSNSTAQYTLTFTITNDLTAASTFTVTASSRQGGQDNGNATVTIVSVDGTAGDEATTASVAASGGTLDVDVVFEVEGTTGDDIELVLDAVATIDTDETDEGHYDLVLVEPSFTVTKRALVDDEGSPGASTISGEVLPGDTFWYEISVEVVGDHDVSNLEVSDALPGEVTFVEFASDNASENPDWGLSESGGTVTGELATLGAGDGPRVFYVKVTVN